MPAHRLLYLPQIYAPNFIARRVKRQRSGAGAGAAVRQNNSDLVIGDEVQVVLLRHPGERRLPPLSRRFLSTVPECTIGHIEKYLREHGFAHYDHVSCV